MAELSGFEVLALVKEIGSRLRGTYVNNIYSLGDAQIIRFRKSGTDDVWLVASPDHGVWISERVAERAETNEFTTRLRRELERARFTGATQEDLDRVFEIGFGEGGSAKTLVVEMMPPGNMLVLDPSRKILLARAEVRSKARRNVVGGTYAAPPQRRISPAEIRPDDVRRMAAEEKTAGEAIGRHVSMPAKYVAEALSRLSLDQKAPSGALIGREDEVVGVLRGLLKQAQEDASPCVCETPRGDEIFVMTPKTFTVRKKADSLSAICDDLLLERVVSKANQEEPAVDTKRRELETTIARLENEARGLTTRAGGLRAAALRASSSSTVEEARKVLDEADIKPGGLIRSSAAAASMLYDEAKEAESRVDDIGNAIARLGRMVPSARKKAGRETKKLTRTRGEWYEKFRWFITTEGKLAIGGRDAHTNSLLVRRHLEDKDTVFHADLFGSPFFILKGGAAQSESEIRQVAQATVAFSSAWKTGLGSADAYWVLPEQVSAAAPSGEYLARGSFGIRGKKNFVGKNFVEVSIGIDAKGRLVAGPEESILRSAKTYVVIRPHKEKSSETAKKVLKSLQNLTGGGDGEKPSLDDVLRALPTGGGKVVRTHSSNTGGGFPPKSSDGP